METVKTSFFAAGYLEDYLFVIYAANQPDAVYEGALEANRVMDTEGIEDIPLSTWDQADDLREQLTLELVHALQAAAQSLGIGLDFDLSRADTLLLVEHCETAWETAKLQAADLSDEEPLLERVKNPLSNEDVVEIVWRRIFDRRCRVPSEEELFGCSIEEMLK